MGLGQLYNACVLLYVLMGMAAGRSHRLSNEDPNVVCHQVTSSKVIPQSQHKIRVIGAESGFGLNGVCVHLEESPRPTREKT